MRILNIHFIQKIKQITWIIHLKIGVITTAMQINNLYAYAKLVNTLLDNKKTLIGEYFKLEKEHDDIYRANRTNRFWELSGRDGLKVIEIEDRQNDIYNDVSRISREIGVIKNLYPNIETYATERINPKGSQKTKPRIDVDLENKIEKYVPRHSAGEKYGNYDSTYEPKHAVKKSLEKTVSGYYERMKDYSDSLSEESILKKCSEILSGDYIKENGRRAWTWKEREDEIRNLYNGRKGAYSENEKEQLEEILQIVNSNKYANRYRKRQVRRIKKIVKKPRESRFRRLLRKIKSYRKRRGDYA